ncbi:MAG: choice-of-anchor Q domain-containing protein [Lysobacteraceae bacterium]
MPSNTRRLNALIASIILFLNCTTAASAASLYVTSDAALDPMATSCTLGAPCHLADAIRIAEGNGTDDQVILVAPSTFIGAATFNYYPDASDLDRDFGIRVDGGSGLFDGNGGEIYIGLKSRHGDLSVQGIQIRNSDASYSEGEWRSPVWNSALSLDSEGGDITVEDVTLWGNERNTHEYTHPGTGGLRVRTQSGAAVVRDSLFLDNDPGGLRLEAEHAEIHDNEFLANRNGVASMAQGGVHVEASTVDMEGNNFSGNSCSQGSYAGGLSVRLRADIPGGPVVNSRVVGNQFLNNDGSECSGGLYLERAQSIIDTFISRVDIDNNQFARNVATAAPGAGMHLYLHEKLRVRARNNRLFDNETLLWMGQSGSGSAIHARLWKDAQLHLLNNTVTENPVAMSSNQGAAVDIETGHYENVVTLYNNIIWDNPTTVNIQGDSDLRIAGDINASVTVRYNDFFAGNIFNGASSSTLDVGNNIATVPGFVDAANEDFHLDAGSNLIDIGSGTSANLPATDMDGQSRTLSLAVDIGADEYSGVPKRQVTINKLGSGTGSVSSLPSGLSCGVGCSSNSAGFDDGTTIGFLSAPSSDTVFVGWGGDCSGSSPGTQLAISGQTSFSCTAEFQPKTHRLIINASGGGQGSVESNYGPSLNWVYPLGGTQRVVADIVPGDDVTITAQVTDSFSYHAVFEDCESQGGTATGQLSGTATCTFSNIQQDRAVSLKFGTGIVIGGTRTLTVTKVGSGDGTVTSSPTGIDCGASCSHAFFTGTDVDLIVVPDGHSVFRGWSGDCPSQSSSLTVTLDTNKNCIANFFPAHNVSVDLDGNGSGAFNDVYHGLQTLYPQFSSQYSARYPADAGSLLFEASSSDSLVSIGGCDDATQGMVLTGNGTAFATCEIGSPTQDNSLTVTYTREQSVLTVNAGGGGSGGIASDHGGISYSYPANNVGHSQPISHGSSITLTATGAGGSTIHWTGCSGPGAVINGEGTGSSSCQIGIYQATTVDVEFRGGTSPGSAIFSDGFE